MQLGFYATKIYSSLLQYLYCETIELTTQFTKNKSTICSKSLIATLERPIIFGTYTSFKFNFHILTKILKRILNKSLIGFTQNCINKHLFYIKKVILRLLKTQ